MTGVFEDHLGPDAVVAYVDGELGLTAYQRAAAHVSRCPSCAGEVAEQVSAQQWLKSAGAPAMPGALFDALRSIPVAMPAIVPAPEQGWMSRYPAVASPGRTPGSAKRTRFGAGALLAGLAVSALMTTASPDRPAPTPTSAGVDRLIMDSGGVGLSARSARWVAGR